MRANSCLDVRKCARADLQVKPMLGGRLRRAKDLTNQSIGSTLKGLEDSMSVNLKDNIKPISYIKTNAADMMKYVNEHKKSIIITQNGEAKAVLVDVESYQAMQDAFNLLKIIKLSEKDVRSGNYRDSDQVFADLNERIKRR